LYIAAVPSSLGRLKSKRQMEAYLTRFQ
jgi:hypothetical protein